MRGFIITSSLIIPMMFTACTSSEITQTETVVGQSAENKQEGVFDKSFISFVRGGTCDNQELQDILSKMPDMYKLALNVGGASSIPEDQLEISSSDEYVQLYTPNKESFWILSLKEGHIADIVFSCSTEDFDITQLQDYNIPGLLGSDFVYTCTLSDLINYDKCVKKLANVENSDQYELSWDVLELLQGRNNDYTKLLLTENNSTDNNTSISDILSNPTNDFDLYTVELSEGLDKQIDNIVLNIFDNVSSSTDLPTEVNGISLDWDFAIPEAIKNGSNLKKHQDSSTSTNPTEFLYTFTSGENPYYLWASANINKEGKITCIYFASVIMTEEDTE